MSELNASSFKKEHGDEGPDLVGVTELTSPYFMVPPSGTTGERPQNPQKGTLRFNTDTASLEYFKGDGLGWESIDRYSPNLNGGARGLFAGGTPGINTIEYITISTLGNATDFGDRTVALAELASTSSRTRGIFWCGTVDPSGHTNTIDYVTIASTGNATDFGDTNDQKKEIAGCSNQIRGTVAGGGGGNGNTIYYITQASTGNSVDFGDLNFGQNNYTATQSATRGFIKDRNEPSGSTQIDYYTFMTTGNASDFGDATDARYGGASMVSSSTRGLFGGGYSPGITNMIEYITMATLGNAIDFGDLTQAGYMCSGCSAPTRGVFGPRGIHPAGTSNIIDYVTIQTTGNAKDFGDATVARQSAAGCSNAHGGL